MTSATVLASQIAAERARPAAAGGIRIDLQLIADIVAPKARVLDVGCGDGALLDYLVHFKQVDGRGIEISQAGVNASVSQGLSVIQGDADTDLKDYPSDAFDYVVLSQTLQATRDPKGVLQQLVRIGRHAIVSFPNFGHWRVRWHLLSHGRMPVTETLTESWYDTPNIHFCTILDFIQLAQDLGIQVERAVVISRQGKPERHPLALARQPIRRAGPVPAAPPLTFSSILPETPACFVIDIGARQAHVLQHVVAERRELPALPRALQPGQQHDPPDAGPSRHRPHPMAAHEHRPRRGLIATSHSHGLSSTIRARLYSAPSSFAGTGSGSRFERAAEDCVLMANAASIAPSGPPPAGRRTSPGAAGSAC